MMRVQQQLAAAAAVAAAACVVAYWLLAAPAPSPPPRLSLDAAAGRLSLSADDGRRLATFDVGFVDSQEATLTSTASPDGRHLTARWPGGGQLQSEPHEPQESQELQCQRLRLSGGGVGQRAQLCLHLGEAGDFAFGGGAAFDQRWPIDEQRVRLQPYVGNDFAELTGAGRSHLWGSFVERMWCSSSGVVLHAEDSAPLLVGQSARRLCWAADAAAPIFRPTRSQPQLQLQLTACWSAGRLPRTLRLWRRQFGRPPPEAAPDRRILLLPVWSSWARFKTNVTQRRVLDLADEAAANGVTLGQLEIDDKFTENYGDLRWDAGKFPDPRAMTQQLRQRGHTVSVWVTPFANVDSDAFAEAAGAGFLVGGDASGGNGSTAAATVAWWNGVAGLVDFTNPDARDWFARRLRRFQQQYGIDSFKFDAGESFYLPAGYRTSRPLSSPLHFTSAYAEFAATFGGLVETRVGYRSQRLPIVVRMFDKDSHWGSRNGLRSLLPTGLMLSLAGYHFVMPDMIGGNGYSADSVAGGQRAERELYIRWLQVSAFFPTMQFSVAPWDYDPATAALAAEAVRLHQRVYLPAFDSALPQLLADGEPPMRPMWWHEPAAWAWADDSQFFVGSDLLVAPVLHRGAVVRDVRLPAGRWVDGNSGAEYDGPRLLKDHPAPLHQVPHFLRR